MKKLLLFALLALAWCAKGQNLFISGGVSEVICNGTLYSAGGNVDLTPTAIKTSVPVKSININGIVSFIGTDALAYTSLYDTIRKSYFYSPINGYDSVRYNGNDFLVKTNGSLWHNSYSLYKYKNVNNNPWTPISLNCILNKLNINNVDTFFSNSFSRDLKDTTLFLGYLNVLKTDGTLWHCDSIHKGKGNFRQVPLVNKIVKINNTTALDNKGNLWDLGSSTIAKPISYLKLYKIKDYWLGTGCGMAIDSTNNVLAWGDNGYGRLGFGDAYSVDYAKPVEGLNGKAINKVLFGLISSVATDVNGNVWEWGSVAGSSPKAKPFQVQGITKVIELQFNDDYYSGKYIAKDSFGNIFTWGANDYGQLGNGTTVSVNKPTLSMFCGSNNTADCALAHPTPRITDTTFNYCAVPVLKASDAIGYSWDTTKFLSCTKCQAPFYKKQINDTIHVTVVDNHFCSFQEKFIVKFIDCKTVVSDSVFTKEIEASPNQGVVLDVPTFSAYNWDNTQYLTCGTCAKPVATVKTSTVFTLKTNESKYNCPVTYTVTVKVRDCNTILKPDTTQKLDTVINPGSFVKLKATYSKTYNWLNSGSLSCTNCQSPFGYLNETKIFKVELLGEKDCPYYQKFLVKVRNCDTVQKPDTTVMLDTVIVPGALVKLKAPPSPSYNWYNITPGNCAICQSITEAPTTNKKYKVRLIGNMGCPYYKAFNIKIRNCDTIVKPFKIKLDTLVYENSVVQLNPSASIADYVWEPNISLSCTNCPNPRVKVQRSDTFKTTVLNKWQCATEELFAINCNCGNNFVPNVITPNSDGFNDVFVVTELAPNTKLQIFDLTGNLVFTDTDYNNQWGGTDSFNNPLPSGTYWYILYLPINKQQLKGFIYIKR